MNLISATNVGSVVFDIVSNSGAFTQQVRKAGNSAQNIMVPAMGKIGRLVAAAFSIKVVTAFAKECIELGSDLSEVQNVVDVTFGQSASKINAWAQTTATAFGISEMHAKQFSGTMGAMLKSMGFATDEAYNMSTSLVELAGDMASFYNLDVQTAFDKIRSGISGETEPLKQLGINMSVANLEAYALSQGISQSYQKMSQANQAALRYSYLLSVTADAQGDFSRTSDSWANQTKILSLQFDSLKTSVGGLLIEVLSPLLRMLNKIMTAANKAATAIAALFGKKASAGGAFSATAESADEASASIADTGTAATKAAKKIKNAFASFDEINVLGNSDKESSGSGDILGGITSGGSVDTGIDYEAIDTETSAFAEAISKHFERISNAAKRIGDSIKGMWENGGRDVFNSLKNIAKNISEIVLIVIGYIAELYADAVEWLAPSVTKSLTGVSDKMDTVNDALEWLKDEGKPILEGIAYTVGIIAAAWAAYKTIQLAVTVATKAFGVAQSIVNAVMTANPIALVVAALSALIAVIILCVKHWDEIKVAAVTAWDKMKATWQTAKDWFNNTVVVPVRNFFSGLWSGIVSTAKNAWVGVKNAFSNAGSFFSGIWDTIKTKLTNIGQKIGDAVGAAFKKAVNAVLTTIENIANAPIKAINKLLDVINTIPGVNIGKLNTFSLPRLAEGGWVAANNPQLAIVGDNKREGEIIAPESKITEAVEKARGIARDIKLAIDVVVNYPDGRRIIKQINQAQLEEGRILLEV